MSMPAFIRRNIHIIGPFLLIICLVPSSGLCGSVAGYTQTNQLGTMLSPWSTLPFFGLLLSIALFPLLVPHLWHNHYGKITFFWAALFSLPFLAYFQSRAVYEIIHIFVIDFIPFLILLSALFSVSGGIVISSFARGTPAVNTALLALGTLLASFLGTTGTSMVLIRPVLKTNADRERKSHIICFFIILVANIGGALTPLGDPPLFLGFLHNVPFFWVTTALVPYVLFAALALLTVFFMIDSFHFKREKHCQIIANIKQEPFKIEGIYNFLFLAGIIASVVMSGYWRAGIINVFGIQIEIQNIVRDALLIVIGIAAFKITPKELRDKNEFNWAPMKEVAKLFAGIFITIIPALEILKSGTAGPLSGLIDFMNGPAVYFWVSGGISSVLDNAPTYLGFLSHILGRLQMTEAMIPTCISGAEGFNGAFVDYLKAISIGSVFMGANTYIGNAPNFMVKSIAEKAGVNMPSFLGYIFKYTIPLLIPLFIILTLVFF